MLMDILSWLPEPLSVNTVWGISLVHLFECYPYDDCLTSSCEAKLYVKRSVMDKAHERALSALN